MHEQTAPIPKAMLPVTRRAPYIAPSLPQLIRYVEEPGLRMLTWRDSTVTVLRYFLALRAMFPQPPHPTSGARLPQQQDLGLAMLDGYIETLANLGGRTGALTRDVSPRADAEIVIFPAWGALWSRRGGVVWNQRTVGETAPR